MENKKDSMFKEYKEQINEAITDLKTKGRRHKQIPNLLTLLRLTAPLVIIPAALLGNVNFIIGSTIFFGLTDKADGTIAKKWDLKSKLGADLDAFADKLYAGTLLIAASVTNPFLLVNVGLEMIIAGININQKTKGKEAASTLMGKAKTVALFILAGLGILASTLSIAPALITGVMAATTLMQVLTISSYLSKYKNKDDKPNSNDKEDVPKLKEEIKEETQQEKSKVLEKEYKNQQDNNLVELRELQSTKDYLLSQQEQPQHIDQEAIKVIQKKMNIKKASGDTK